MISESSQVSKWEANICCAFLQLLWNSYVTHLSTPPALLLSIARAIVLAWISAFLEMSSCVGSVKDKVWENSWALFLASSISPFTSAGCSRKKKKYRVNHFGMFVSWWEIPTLGGSLGVLACVLLDCPWACLLLSLVPDNAAPFIIMSWALLTAPYCGSPPVWFTHVCRHCASLPCTLSSVFYHFP